MELFEIATEVECISIKADCFSTIAATLGLNADDSRCLAVLLICSSYYQTRRERYQKRFMRKQGKQANSKTTHY